MVAGALWLVRADLPSAPLPATMKLEPRATKKLKPQAQESAGCDYMVAGALWLAPQAQESAGCDYMVAGRGVGRRGTRAPGENAIASMDELRVSRDGAVATITLNRPEKHNAITVAMWDALPGVLAPLAADTGVRAVVVRGAGDEAFASGADISEFEQVRSGAAAARAYSARVAGAERALADFPKPAIAMIHGFCVGGGLELALACDFRWTSPAGRFGITAARLGIVYSTDATRRLARLVGPSHARDLLFSGRLVDAAEARAMGLVSRVCAPGELEKETYAYAHLLAQQAPLSQQGAKAMLQHLAGEGTMTGEDIAAFIEAAYESADYREGVRAFLARRPARFEGR